jgi:hypothetical protein
VSDAGTSFAAELEELLARCEAVVERARKIRELRGREGRVLGEEARARLAAIAIALELLASEPDDEATALAAELEERLRAQRAR